MDELVAHLAEEERQLVLLALAVLNCQSPGFECAACGLRSRCTRRITS